MSTTSAMPLTDGSVFRAAVENAPTGIVVCDGGGPILFVNAQLAAAVGYTSDELRGRGIDRRVPAAPPVDGASQSIPSTAKAPA